MPQTFQLIISGQVQGVGFRPFVYQLARKLDLKGSVCNNENGVLILIKQNRERAVEFLNAVLEKAPEASIVQSHSILETDQLQFDDFQITTSKTLHQIDIPLTPDFAICESCKTEIRDTSDSRFGYPFTTCTNCGPRYAITTKFPFEREHTTVASFQMCASCQEEYSNPADRRFHSQTNSCAECGIRLWLTSASGEPVSVVRSELLKKTSGLISDGNIIAIKNTNGYLLCCDAGNKAVIERLRGKKQRPAKPFALLYPSLERVKNNFELNSAEEQALLSPVAPIVILNPKDEIKGLEQESIAPGLGQLGVMLPSSALLTLLMDELQAPIIATSGNMHGSPIISSEKDGVGKLSEVADYFLHHNLEISFPQDDSVIRFAGEQQIMLRRSRGSAPNYMGRSYSGKKKVLAMGAHLKSSFAFVPNSHTYVSPYFGNLDSYDVSERLKKNIHQFIQLFQTLPEVVLIDSHPQYQSSVLGRELSKVWNAELIPVQHHKAHFASVLGEHGLFDSKEKILGVVWDGTGFGEDAAIWGGEFFSYDNYEMKRLDHFEYVDWLAADKMAKEPRLSLLAMLPEEERGLARGKFSETEWKVYTKMLEGNKLKTSSVGRLFDAVASLLDTVDIASYEGQAAMLLENRAGDCKGDGCIDFLEGVAYETIPSKKLIKNIWKAKEAGVSKAHIAHSFIHTLALAVLKMAKQGGYSIIACSGGVFQNALLVEKLVKLAEKAKADLKFNRILSSNDENVSFGQLAYYQHIKK